MVSTRCACAPLAAMTALKRLTTTTLRTITSAALFEPYFVTYDADPESYASLPAVFARIIKL